jgi:hypothetical protein
MNALACTCSRACTATGSGQVRMREVVLDRRRI